MVTLSLLLALAASHPLHTTLTSVEWLPQRGGGGGGVLRVSVRVYGDDLGQALARRRAVSADPDGFAEAACAYAHEVVIVRTARARVPVIGCAVDRGADVVWIRLEHRLATGPAGLRVSNALLFELFDDQINIVQAKVVGRARTLIFTRGDGPKPVG
jgi:hypothetical protein